MRLLVDAHGILYRSAYKLDLRDRHGDKTNIIFGTLRSLEAIANETRATEMVVVWDRRSDARIQMFPEYKAQRKRDPEFVEDFERQVSLLESLLRNLPILQIWHEGVEADDAIAVLCRFLHLERVGIVTGDQDLYQLARGPLHTIIDYHGEEVDLSEALKVPLKQHLAFKALVGDSSDNIPGVTQIGPVRAKRLLDEHGTLKEILRAHKGVGTLGAMSLSEARHTLKRNLALMSLGRLLTDEQRSSIVKQYQYGRLKTAIDVSNFRKLLMSLGFTSIVRRLSGFLIPFKRMVRDMKDANLRQEDPKGERLARRLRVVASALHSGEDSNRQERRKAQTTTKRIRKVETKGVAATGRHRGPKRAVRPATRKARRKRADLPTQGVLHHPKVLKQRRARRGEALQLLSSLQTPDGWEWLCGQSSIRLKVVRRLIVKLQEDEEFIPSRAAIEELKGYHSDFVNELPDWMKQ
jgi:5'-3' exonuclease